MVIIHLQETNNGRVLTQTAQPILIAGGKRHFSRVRNVSLSYVVMVIRVIWVVTVIIIIIVTLLLFGRWRCPQGWVGIRKLGPRVLCTSMNGHSERGFRGDNLCLKL